MKISLDKFKSVIDIKQSEKSTFSKLFIHSFLIGVANSFFLVETSKVFITKVNIAEIPLAYIISGLIGLILIKFFKRAQNQFGQIIGYELIIYIFFISILIIYLGQLYLVNSVFYIKSIAYLGFALIFAFLTLFNVGFAGICSSVFNFSQSKRLIGLLGIGEVIASIIGFLIVPIIVKITGNSNSLLILTMIFSIFSIIPIRKIAKESVNKISVSKKLETKNTFNINYIINNPFVFYLSLTTLFSIATLYFVDYSYLISVRNYSNLARIETTIIVAVIFCIIKAGELLFSLFSSNIISKIGMKNAGLLLPNLLIIGSILCLFAIIFFSGSPLFIIIFLFINKFIERVIRKSITVPARKVMYQINTPEDRIFLQNNIDGTMMQLSTVFSGVILFLLCTFTKISNYNLFLQIISILNFLIFVLFLLFSLRLFKNYQSQIRNFLNNNYKQNNIISELANNNISAIKTIDILNEISKGIDFTNNDSLLSLIIYYNPSASTSLNLSKSNPNRNEIIFKIISRLYFENQNYFNRVAILSYVINLEFIFKLNFLKNNINITPIKLRLYLLESINNNPGTVPDTHTFFLNELINSCIQEILWTDSATYDLNLFDETELLIQLKIHKQELTNMLLNILKLTHDKNSINIVKNIINNPDLSEEDSFFVCELLENILKADLKEIIIPIFEPINYQARKNKCRQHFFISNLSVQDRLSDILMHDFNILDIYIKQLTIQLIKTEKFDNSLIKAFESSQIINLKIASKVDTETNHLLLDNKIAISKKVSKYFSFEDKYNALILRWIFKENMIGRKNNQIENNLSNIYKSSLSSIGIDDELLSELNIDLVAPILLNKIQ